MLPRASTTALVLAVCAHGAAALASTRAKGKLIFDYLPRSEQFPACLKTVVSAQKRLSGPLSSEAVEPLCERIVSSAPRGPGKKTEGVVSDCAELSGRIVTAGKNGFLDDGSNFCAKLVRESAAGTHAPLTEYLPNGKASRHKFCHVFAKGVEVPGEKPGTPSRWVPDTLADLCALSERPAAAAPKANATQHNASNATEPKPAAARAAQLFREADADGDGSLSRAEFQRALELKEHPPKAQAAAAPSRVPVATVSSKSAKAEDGQKMSTQYMKKNFGSILRWGKQ